MGRVVKCDQIVKRRDVDRRILREQDQKIIEQKRQAEQHDPVFGDQEGALIRYHGANHTEGRQHQQENQIIEIGVVYKQAGK